MTISRKAGDALAAFMATLPETVKWPATRQATKGGVWCDWPSAGVSFVFEEDANDYGPNELASLRARLIEHYRPKPREVTGWMHPDAFGMLNKCGHLSPTAHVHSRQTGVSVPVRITEIVENADG